MELEDSSKGRHQDLAKRVSLGITEIDAYRLNSPRSNGDDTTDKQQAQQKAMRKHAETLSQAFTISVADIVTGIGTLQSEHTESANEIKQHPPATSNFVRGALAGGSAAYLLSFFAAKALTLAFVAVGDKDRWAFAPLAGILHATAGEIIGGGLRSTYATYESPDGKLWADFVSAMSNYALFAIGGSAKGRTQARKDMGAAIRNIQKSLDERLGQDPKRSRAIALFGAWWRSLVCDELAFIGFALTYVITGGILPILRRMEDKSASIAIDFSATLACGLIGGSLTGVLQNLMRQHYQRAAFKTGANHNAERVATQELLTRTIAAIERERAEVEAIRDKFLNLFNSTDDQEAQAMHRAIGDEAEETLKDIDQTLTTYRQELLALQGREGLAVAAKAIKTAAKNMFGGPAAAATPWVDSFAKARRLQAKCIGNTAAVASYLVYMATATNVLYPLLPMGMGNQTDPGMGNSTHVPPIETMEVVDYAMHGFVLIGAWCARSLVSNAIEMVAVPTVVGTPMRLFTAGEALFNWATRSTAPVPAQAANQNQSGDSDSSSISEEDNDERGDARQANEDADPVRKARNQLKVHQDNVIDMKDLMVSVLPGTTGEKSDQDKDG